MNISKTTANTQTNSAMKYYVIPSATIVTLIGVNRVTEEESSVLEKLEEAKVFNATWFRGEKTCSCCDTITNLFYLGESQVGNNIFDVYLSVDADDVFIADSKEQLPSLLANAGIAVQFNTSSACAP